MNFIINLTSYGDRIEKTTPYTICSLLNQSEAPDKLILWLDHNSQIPPILKKFCDIGLEIKFCRDLKSYTKIIPALAEFQNDVLITADDDVFYPTDWFAKLKKAFLKDPSKIYCHRAHRIQFDKNGDLDKYNNWHFCTNAMTLQPLIFPTGVGGILYPPNSLHYLVSDSDTFLRIAPTADDVWLWAMGRLQGTKYEIIQDGYCKVKSIDDSQFGLWEINRQGENDRQINNILKQFPSLLNDLLKIKMLLKLELSNRH